MLPKKFRLTQRQVRYLLAKGMRRSLDLYVLCIAPSRADVHRFGVMVSTKVYAKAVERNRARRQVYGVIERWLKTAQGSDEKWNVMVIVRRPVTSKNLPKLYQLLNNTLI